MSPTSRYTPWLAPTATAPTPSATQTGPAVRITLTGVLGGALLLLAVLGLVLNFSVDWMKVDVNVRTFGVAVENSSTLDRGDFTDGGAYASWIATWSLTGLIAGIVLGAALPALDLWPALAPSTRDSLRTAAVGLLALAGFMVLLAGLRTFNMAFSLNALRPRTTTATPLMVPYVNVIIGVAILGVAVWRLWGTVRPALSSAGFSTRPWGPLSSAAAAAIAALALLLLPLLPFVRLGPEGGSRSNVWEFLLDAIEDGTLENVGRDVAFARGLLWTTMFLGIVAVAGRAVARARPDVRALAPLPHIFVLAGIPIVGGLVFSILFYTDVGNAEGVSLSWNHVAVLAYVALSGAFVVYVTLSFLPWLRSVRAAAATTMSTGVASRPS